MLRQDIARRLDLLRLLFLPVTIVMKTLIMLPCYLTPPGRKMQYASELQMPQTPPINPQNPTVRKTMPPHTQIPKKKAPGRVWTLTFLLGAEQTNQTNPKIPAPTVHADRSLHSTATKNLFFEPTTTTRLRPSAHDAGPIMKGAVRRLWLLACPALWNPFSSSEEWASGPGPAWCVEGGGDGVSACVVLSSVLPLAARGPVFFSGKCDPRCLPLVAPRPPLRE